MSESKDCQKVSQKKKLRKKFKSLSQLSKLHNLNMLLMKMQREINLEEPIKLSRNDVYFLEDKNKNPKNTNLKLSQKTEIMTEFWKVVDRKFFKQDRFQQEEEVEQFQTKEQLFKEDYLKEYNIEEQNKLNLQNFRKAVRISEMSYLLCLRKLQKHQQICELCLHKIEQILSDKFGYKIPKSFTTNKKIVKFLNDENKCYQKILSKKMEFCNKCGEEGDFLEKVIKKLEKLLKSKKSEIKMLQKSQPKTQSMFEIAKEIEQIKNFLEIHLKEIEEKILADNIQFIIGKKKNLIYVKFIQFQNPFPISEDELQRLNRFRENSLYKTHRVSFKTSHSEYSYNLIFKKYKNKQKKFFDEDHYNYLELTNNLNSSKEWICHHCKYVGPSQMFFKCTQKFPGFKDFEKEIFKEIFAIKSNLRKECSKKYCINCIQKCYHYSLKEDKKTWTCPFCSGHCYCLSCEYRDHYMRLFALYQTYNGKIEKLRENSLMERIISYFTQTNSQIDQQRNRQLKLTQDHYPNMRLHFKIEPIDEISQIIKKRQKLIDELELARLITKRETLKYKIAENLQIILQIN